MRQKERQDNRPPTESGANSGGSLDELREQANRFLAAGDAAIDRALANTDSTTFLRANRQQGGQ